MKGDPNFVVDYKRLLHIDFMEVSSDPDLIATFPTLSNISHLGGISDKNDI